MQFFFLGSNLQPNNLKTYFKPPKSPKTAPYKECSIVDVPLRRAFCGEAAQQGHIWSRWTTLAC